MTRKDYRLAAKVVIDMCSEASLEGQIPLTNAKIVLMRLDVTEAFCRFFLASDGRFDEKRFRTACGG